jgi:hypothetical protein
MRPATIALQSQQPAVAFWRLRPVVYGPRRAWSECANDIMLLYASDECPPLRSISQLKIAGVQGGL